ncbi:alpha/beta hydrolase fold domain-containing protein [Tropicibacter sp. S64]|uniref:alpha/beta hydrolase fold domain-containing protein n=1 Tax=Tropicibacter sp. S64 TaxID=3415122 RepID=UPI003C7B4F35
MENDGYTDALAQEPQALLTEHFPLADGSRYWPTLAYALTIGYRPMMLDLRVPQGPGPHPLVIYIHGGAWYLGTPKYNNAALRALRIEDRLLDAGYAMARISYRLSSEAKWPAQLHDCKAAVRFLRHHAGRFALDPDRFAVMGESAGGHLAAMVALTGDDPAHEGEIGETGTSSAVQAAINWYGATDLSRFRTDGTRPPMQGIVAHRPEDLLVGDGSEAPRETLRQASPVAHVTAKAPPFLHQHGDTDRLVTHDHAVQLHQLLCDAGAPSELDIVSGADHCFHGATSDAILDRTIAFLNARLA